MRPPSAGEGWGGSSEDHVHAVAARQGGAGRRVDGSCGGATTVLEELVGWEDTRH